MKGWVTVKNSSCPPTVGQLTVDCRPTVVQAMAQQSSVSQLFKQWRNKIQHAIRSCKETYYNSKVQNLKETRVGKWWKEILKRPFGRVRERESVALAAS